MAAVAPPGRSDGVEVGLLGPVTLAVDGLVTPVTGVRQRAVLAVLAASTPAAVPAERLADAVWSDTGRPASRSTLQVHVHQLRRLLGRHGGTLRHTAAGYLLDGADVDLRAGEEQLRRARAAERAGDIVGAAACFRLGLAQWRGEFCADLPDHGYLRAARALYATLRLDGLEAAIAAELRTGGPGLAGELGALVEEHPLRERFWGQLMVALYRDGRQADALAAYRRARAVLAAEVGLDPGAALRQLERAILDQAGTTALLRVVAPTAAAGTSRPVLTWLDGAGTQRGRELPPSGSVMIGRADAADIALTWDAAVSRQHAAVVVAEGTASVVDLGSRNGTFHNGMRLPPPAGSTAAGPPAVGGGRLRVGDLLRCGDTLLAVCRPAGRGPAPLPGDDTRTVAD